MSSFATQTANQTATQTSKNTGRKISKKLTFEAPSKFVKKNGKIDYSKSSNCLRISNLGMDIIPSELRKQFEEEERINSSSIKKEINSNFDESTSSTNEIPDTEIEKINSNFYESTSSTDEIPDTKVEESSSDDGKPIVTTFIRNKGDSIGFLSDVILELLKNNPEVCIPKNFDVNEILGKLKTSSRIFDDGCFNNLRTLFIQNEDCYSKFLEKIAEKYGDNFVIGFNRLITMIKSLVVNKTSVVYVFLLSFYEAIVKEQDFSRINAFYNFIIEGTGFINLSNNKFNTRKSLLSIWKSFNKANSNYSDNSSSTDLSTNSDHKIEESIPDFKKEANVNPNYKGKKFDPNFNKKGQCTDLSTAEKHNGYQGKKFNPNFKKGKRTDLSTNTNPMIEEHNPSYKGKCTDLSTAEKHNGYQGKKFNPNFKKGQCTDLSTAKKPEFKGYQGKKFDPYFKKGSTKISTAEASCQSKESIPDCKKEKPVVIININKKIDKNDIFMLIKLMTISPKFEIIFVYFTDEFFDEFSLKFNNMINNFESGRIKFNSSYRIIGLDSYSSINITGESYQYEIGLLDYEILENLGE